MRQARAAYAGLIINFHRACPFHHSSTADRAMSAPSVEAPGHRPVGQGAGRRFAILVLPSVHQPGSTDRLPRCGSGTPMEPEIEGFPWDWNGEALAAHAFLPNQYPYPRFFQPSFCAMT